MKRCGITLGFFLLLCFALAGTAKGADLAERQQEAYGVDRLEEELPAEAADVLEHVTVTDSLNLDQGLGKLWEALPEAAGNALGQAVKSGGALIAVSALCALLTAVTGDSGTQRVIPCVGVAAVCALSAGNVHTFLGLGTDLLDDMDTFSKVLLPTLTATAAAGGAVTSAGAKYAATALFVDILLTVGKTLVVPLIFAYLAASIGASAFESPALSRAAGMLKWIAGSIMTLTVTGFVLYLTLSGVISGTADAAATRLTKTVISTALPVVGGIISDAAGAVVAGANVLKNAVGIFGLLAVCAMCLAPVLQLGAQFLLYKGVSVLSQTLAGKSVSDMIDAVGNAFGMLLGLVGSVAVMLFVSVISMLKVVTGG